MRDTCLGSGWRAIAPLCWAWGLAGRGLARGAEHLERQEPGGTPHTATRLPYPVEERQVVEQEGVGKGSRAQNLAESRAL